MTPAQQRAISRRNAQKSTGPKTAEGKEHSSRNSLKHGLCAAHFVLIIEDTEELQREFDEWVEHYQPVGPAESALVKDIAVSQLKLNRCQRREAAVVDLQVRAAYKDWNYAQEDKLDALKQLLATDPVTASRELKRFSAGRRWLIDRWMSFARWLKRDGCCGTPALVDEAVRLLGGNHLHYATGPLLAYVFRLCCTGARPVPDPDVAAWLLSESVIHPDYQAEHGCTLPEPEVCRNELRRIVAQEVEALEEEEKGGSEDEQAEGAGACCRAQLPADTGETKLALRYESMHRSALHKAMKELERLQKERFAAEAELDALPDAVPVAARNEPDTPPEPPPSAVIVMTCDACEDTNPEVSSAGAMPTSPRSGAGLEDFPMKTWACHPPELPVVGPEGADSPPA